MQPWDVRKLEGVGKEGETCRVHLHSGGWDPVDTPCKRVLAELMETLWAKCKGWEPVEPGLCWRVVRGQRPEEEPGGPK